MMHVMESLGNLIRLCEMWPSAIKYRASWHGIKCLHSCSAVRAWWNRKVCGASCRCVFGLIVSNRVNLHHKRHLDSNAVGYRFNAVQYIMLFHKILQWQQQNINRKGYSCQSLFVKCIDNWKNVLDQHQYIGALFMDLSKAFDCLPSCMFMV